MNLIKTTACLLVSAALAGCITPGPLTDSEFIETTLPISHDTALTNLRKGWDVCDYPQYGQPSFMVLSDHSIIDVHGVSMWLKDVNNIKIGTIEIWRLDDELVKVRAGIHRNFINGKRRQNWLKWAQGNYVCQW